MTIEQADAEARRMHQRLQAATNEFEFGVRLALYRAALDRFERLLAEAP